MPWQLQTLPASAIDEKLQPVVNAHFLYVELGKAQVVLRLKALITMLR